MWFFMNGKIKPMTDSCKDLGAKRRIVVDTIKQWARIKGIEIIEGHAMPDVDSTRDQGPCGSAFPRA